MQNSVQPRPMPRYLLGRISLMPGYPTKMTPAPKPMMVLPAAAVRVVLAVAPMICTCIKMAKISDFVYTTSPKEETRELRRGKKKGKIKGHTPPTSVKACPEIRTHRRPKMSLSPPAIEKATAEATDHPPGIQMMLSVSPSVCPICCKMPVGRRRPAEMAGT